MTGPFMKRAWDKMLVPVLLLCAVGLSSPARAASAWLGRVEYVVDGDTVHVRSSNGGELHKIRLLGIDAPEICQAWGQKARRALDERLAGRQVMVKGGNRDDYQRTLATVWLDGQDVGAWMVTQGHAWSYRWRDQGGPYERQELHARRQSLGLFSEASAQSPHSFRRRHGSCYLN